MATWSWASGRREPAAVFGLRAHGSDSVAFSSTVAMHNRALLHSCRILPGSCSLQAGWEVGNWDKCARASLTYILLSAVNLNHGPGSLQRVCVEDEWGRDGW